MKNLYLAYDETTFEEAVKNTDTSCDSWDEIHQLLYFLMDWGYRDLQVGGCKSFRIFDQDGRIAFESHKKPIIQSGEVA